MQDMRMAKFMVRVIFTAALMTIGAIIFFTSDDTGNQVLGTNMITVGWATWMSSGKVKKDQNTPSGIDIEDPVIGEDL